MAATKVKVILSDGDYFSTWIHLDAQKAKDYYLHRKLNMASGEKEDNYKKCILAEVLKERDTIPHYNSVDY